MITTPIRLEGCVVQRCSTWRGPLECSSARTAAESGFPFATPIPRLRVKPSWRLNPSSVPIDPRPRRWLLLLVVVEPHLATRRFGCHVRMARLCDAPPLVFTAVILFLILFLIGIASSGLVLLFFHLRLSLLIFLRLCLFVFLCTLLPVHCMWYMQYIIIWSNHLWCVSAALWLFVIMAAIVILIMFSTMKADIQLSWSHVRVFLWCRFLHLNRASKGYAGFVLATVKLINHTGKILNPSITQTQKTVNPDNEQQ